MIVRIFMINFKPTDYVSADYWVTLNNLAIAISNTTGKFMGDSLKYRSFVNITFAMNIIFVLIGFILFYAGFSDFSQMFCFIPSIL